MKVLVGTFNQEKGPSPLLRTFVWTFVWSSASHPPALLLRRNVTDTVRVLPMASLLSCRIVQFVPGAGQCGHCHFIFSQIRRGDEEGSCVPAESRHLQFSQLDNHRIPAATSTSTTSACSLLTGYCWQGKGERCCCLNVAHWKSNEECVHRRGPVSRLAPSCGSAADGASRSTL